MKRLPDEYLDVVDDQDVPTGVVKLKSAIHRDGDWHRGAHMWLYNDQCEVLFQRRSPMKDTFPNLWDITGGHVGVSESYDSTAIRELREELGITVSLAELEKLYLYRDALINREFQQIYLLRYNRSVSTFHLQVEEVSTARFFPLFELKTRLTDPQERLAFCPVYAYYLAILELIEKRLPAAL